MIERLSQLFSVGFIVAGIRFATPLLFAATGEVIAQRAGLLNVDLEAMMLTGAFAAVLVSFVTGNAWLGVLAGGAAGGVLAMVKAVACVTFNARQAVAGTAMNILAAGLTVYGARYAFGYGNAPIVPALLESRIPYLSSIPLFGPMVFSHSPLVYLAFFLVPLSSFVLLRTRWGLNLRAVGEYPAAADAVGIRVIETRYAALLVCGVLSGLGGASITLGQLRLFVENVSAGRGFVALAAVVFGRWMPLRVMVACLFFGFCQAAVYVVQMWDIPVPRHLILAMPYALTAAAFAVSAGKAVGPAALGRPYTRE